MVEGPYTHKALQEKLKLRENVDTELQQNQRT